MTNMQIWDKFLLVVETSRPMVTDKDVEERAEEVEAILSSLQTLLVHFYAPGGHYYKKGYALHIERR